MLIIVYAAVFQIQDIKMLSESNNVAITTHDTLYMHGACPGDDIITIDHVVGGKMTCMDCNKELIAVGIGPYGYGILGNTVSVAKLEKWENPSSKRDKKKASRGTFIRKSISKSTIYGLGIDMVKNTLWTDRGCKTLGSFSPYEPKYCILRIRLLKKH